MPPRRGRFGGGLLLCLALWGLITASGCNSTSLAPPTFVNSTSDLEKMREALEDMRGVVDNLQQLVKAQLTTPTTATPTFPPLLKPHHPAGVMYVRWGRKSCPPGTEMVYSGNAGGGFSGHTGSPTNPLCLPLDPMYANFTPIINGSNFLYGMEYMSYNNLPNFHNHRQDVPCSVCLNPRRSHVFMLPARTACQDGWTVEYFGYLMAGKYDQAASTEYICVDHQPENVDGGESSEGQHYLFFVKTACTRSVRCPPYKSGREVTCAVCSR